MKPALEALLGPDQDVRGRPCASKRLIGKLAAFALVWRRIGDDDQQVEVAIWPVVAARLGTEEVDALRLVGVDQTLDDARVRFSG